MNTMISYPKNDDFISKKEKKAIIILCIFAFIFLIIVCLNFYFTPRLSKEQRQEIIDTFAEYDSKGGVVYSHDNYIFLPEKRIDFTSVKYNEQKCYGLISCGAESCYAFTREKIDSKHIAINILEISYADSSIKYIDTLSNLPNESISSFCIDNKLYFGIFDGQYYIYDLDEKTYTTSPKSAVDTFREAQNKYEFKILYNKNILNKKYYGLEITAKVTQEKRTITMDDLDTFPEGQYILSLNHYFTDLFFSTALEKDGDIYILGMIDLDTIAGMQHQNVVLKYNFETEKLSYYSSMYLEWDEPPKMYIL